MTSKSLITLTLLLWAAPAAAQGPSHIRSYIEAHCLDCHDSDRAKGNLNLQGLGLHLGDPKTLTTWVRVYDRVSQGEMPPGKSRKPPAAQTRAFLGALADPLAATDLAVEAVEGRSTRRRLNRHEYENTLRDLFDAPWLQLKDLLPEDGEAHRFNKVGEALDVSFVQMAQYLIAAEQAIRQVLAAEHQRADTTTVRYHTRDMKSFTGKMTYNEFNNSPDRATFPVLGFAAQPDVRSGQAPLSVGSDDPKTRELEGMGVTAGAYEPLEPSFNGFKAPTSGLYRLRLRAHTIWAAPNGKNGKGRPQPWYPDYDSLSRGRRSEPVTLYARSPPRLLRRLGAVDVTPEPSTLEMEVHLLAGETIAPDASRLFRSRPSTWRNPFATPEGVPGVVYRWLEVEGPIYRQWPPRGRTLLFGNLEPAVDSQEFVSNDPEGDARRLMDAFLQRVYRHPAKEEDLGLFVDVVKKAMAAGSSFTDAMIVGYSAVLCSPRFVYLEEEPGQLDESGLATRLAYFLWNSPADEELLAAAGRGELGTPQGLSRQADRMLADTRSQRFVESFLNYWLDLRYILNTSPDAELYGDYYLDDLLQESALLETNMFFSELLRRNLPARNLVASNFVMVNERLAQHYGLPPVKGVQLRPVRVPAGSPRGGLLTQASVLKVTANGTTTSPVLRGVWINERLLGHRVPPPPPGVPAVEPDTRGARTIREQLEKHRADKTCAGCHAKIDPAGFALESFDVLGGWRDRYRALGEGTRVPGIGKGGHDYAFHLAQPVDSSGILPTGQKFKNVVDLKRLLLHDERQIARNLAQQLLVFATGAPVRFGDRFRIESILDRARPGGYGVRTLVHEIVKSDAFRTK